MKPRQRELEDSKLEPLNHTQANLIRTIKLRLSAFGLQCHNTSSRSNKAQNQDLCWMTARRQSEKRFRSTSDDPNIDQDDQLQSIYSIYDAASEEKERDFSARSTTHTFIPKIPTHSKLSEACFGNQTRPTAANPKKAIPR